MQKLFLILFIVGFCSCGNTYYIVRHAEKAQAAGNTGMFTTADPPLTEKGAQRAEALKDKLQPKNIKYIFSTNTTRTLTTAAPLSNAIQVKPVTYGPAPDAAFINKLKNIHQNTLIVGHSNTVDDIVNGLCGQVKVPGDLPESQYGDLFIVKKKGKQYHFIQQHFGQ